MPKHRRREDFLFLTDDEFNDADNNAEKLLLLNRTGIDRYNTIKHNYGMERKKNDLRIVLLGGTGAGKSSTGNTILGAKKFKEDISTMSVTKYSSVQSVDVDGRTISILDTPGLFDTKLSNADIIHEISVAHAFFSEGVNAFIIVQNLSTPRFTKEERQILEILETLYGGDFSSFRILLFTRSETYLGKESLSDYVQARNVDGDPELKKFFDSLEGRIIAVNNATTVPMEKERNRNEIIKMVDEVGINNREVYTNEHFEKARKQKEAFRKKGEQDGWDQRTMEAVESFLKVNTDILKKSDSKTLLEKFKQRVDIRRQMLQQEIMEEKNEKLKEKKNEELIAISQNQDQIGQIAMGFFTVFERGVKVVSDCASSIVKKMEAVWQGLRHDLSDERCETRQCDNKETR